MGWQERDYRSEEAYETRAAGGGIRRPPNGALALMIVHGLAYLLIAMLNADTGEQAVRILNLLDVRQHPLGILLHPLANGRLLSALFVVLALWSLGGRIETRLGTQRLLVLYVAGNLVAGGLFFGFAQFTPAMANEPLDYPAGALAALVGAAWHHLRHDAVQVLGRVTNVAMVYLVAAGIVVVMVLFRAGSGGAAWVLAAAGGGGVGLALERYGMLRMPSGRRRRVVKPSIPRHPRPKVPDIDDVLAKISRSGMDSLTDAERKRLEAARRARQGDDL
jgi:membrane associated rhomboid family serine protease